MQIHLPTVSKRSLSFGKGLTLVVLFLGSPTLAQVFHWQQQYDGPANTDDAGVKVKSDAAGNVYVIANSEGDIITLKYNAAGVQQWAVRYDSVYTSEKSTTLHTQDRATDLLVDAAGNAYVTGTSYFEGNCNQVSAVTLRYNTSGERQWKLTNTATASCGGASQMQDPQLRWDGSRHLYLMVSYQDASGPANQIVLQQITLAGSQVWKSAFGGSGATTRLEASLLAVDQAGNTYIGGSSSTGGLLLKYANDGTLQWQKPVNASAIVADAAGNLLVTVGAGDIFTTQYNAAGEQQWQATYNSGTYYDDGANLYRDVDDAAKAILVDTSGNVYVAAQSTGSPPNCSYTSTYLIKYNHEGVEQWTSGSLAYNSCYYGAGEPRLALDVAQNPCVATAYDDEITGHQIALKKLSPDNRVTWDLVYGAYPISELGATDLHVDALGNAYVTGYVDTYESPNGNALTLKYADTDFCTATGSILREYWADLPGHNLLDIPLNTPPTARDPLTVLRTRANVANHYGQRIRGYLCAPTTGDYTFFIQGDDVAELYLSTDSQPANKQRLASARLAWNWNEQAGQQSAAVQLVAGRRYYLEVLHKEGGGGDVVRVGWRTPGMAADSEPPVIPGSALSPAPYPTGTPIRPLAYLGQNDSDGAYFVIFGWGYDEQHTGLVVERATTATGPFVKLASTQAGATEILDFRVAAGTTYHYRVYAQTENGSTGYSKVASITLPNACSASGTVRRELWLQAPGRTVASIPLNLPPSLTDELTSLSTPANAGDDYGQRIRGYLCAPASGTYQFFLQGDDEAELYLSPDSEPGQAQRIARARASSGWFQTAEQQSAAIQLVAGQRYYVEVLHKEGTGSDGLRAGWRTPQMAADSEPVVIPGTVLSPYAEVSNGLLACYAFSGNANDGSGQANQGVVHGGATLVADRFGQANSAYAFDGADDVISLSADQFQASQYSYSVWAKPASLPTSQSIYGVFSVGGYGGAQGLLLSNWPASDDQPSGWQLFSSNRNSDADIYASGMLPALDSWVHLVMTHDGSRIKLYVNGALVGGMAVKTYSPSPYYGNVAFDGPVRALIGSHTFRDNAFFQGALDDVQVYNYPLSAAEVAALYQKTGDPCSTKQVTRAVEQKEEVPASLLKAYPNPTTGTTTVAFTALETGWLSVALYNLQGQPIQQLFGREVEVGSTHQRVLEGDGLPEGLYLLRLVNGQHGTAQKLVIVR